MRCVVLLMAVLVFVPGCFVLDELDKGAEIMDQHSPKRAAERAEPKPTRQAAPSGKGKEDEGGLLAGVQGWLREKKPAERSSSPPPDPDDVPVLCQSAGRTQYVRKSDCLLRGGKVL